MRKIILTLKTLKANNRIVLNDVLDKVPSVNHAALRRRSIFRDNVLDTLVDCAVDDFVVSVPKADWPHCARSRAA